MGVREITGGIVEGFLNEALDKYLNAEELKAKIYKLVDELIDEQLDEMKEKVKANMIDLIDGVDDIPDVD